MSEPAVSTWLSIEGGTYHYSCGPLASAEAYRTRVEEARVAVVNIGECCGRAGCEAAPEERFPCSFDLWDDAETCRAGRLVSEGLARAEGRSPRPFTRGGPCSRHGQECTA